MQKKYKYQTRLVTIPSATAAGSTTDTGVTLDRSYDVCTGISVQQVSDGGIANAYYRVGFKDENNTYQNLTHVGNLKAGDAVAPNEKYLDVNIPITDGQQFDIQTNIPAVLVTDLIYEVSFRLEYYEVINDQ